MTYKLTPVKRNSKDKIEHYITNYGMIITSENLQAILSSLGYDNFEMPESGECCFIKIGEILKRSDEAIVNNAKHTNVMTGKDLIKLRMKLNRASEFMATHVMLSM